MGVLSGIELARPVGCKLHKTDAESLVILTIDFWRFLWYTISVKGRGAVRQTLNSGVPVGVTADRPHLDRLGNRSEVAKRLEPTAEEYRVGVWQSAFLASRTVASGAIPEEPRTSTRAQERKVGSVLVGSV